MSEKPTPTPEEITPVPTPASDIYSLSMNPPNPYSSQKVTMTVTPGTGFALPSGKTNLLALVTSPEQGITKYPGLNLYTDTSTAPKGPWSIYGICRPDGRDAITWETGFSDKTTWPAQPLDPDQPVATKIYNQSATGQAVNATSSQYPQLWILEPVTVETPPSLAGKNQIPISINFSDSSRTPLNTPVPMVALIQAENKATFTDYFSVYAGADANSATKVTSIENQVAAVESQGPDNNTLKCWIVPAPNQKNVGTTVRASASHGFDYGTALIIDTESATGFPDSDLPTLDCIEADGDGIVAFDTGTGILSAHLSVDNSVGAQDVLQNGDRLILLLNGAIAQNIPPATYAGDNSDILFAIPWNHPQLRIGPNGQPADNDIAYLKWTPSTVPGYSPIVASNPGDLYTQWGQNKPIAGGPPTPTGGFGAPCIYEHQPGTLLVEPEIAQGIHAQVVWDGTNRYGVTSNWKQQPQAGDTITVNLYMSGWGADGEKKSPDPIVATKSYTFPAEIPSGGYVKIPLDNDFFQKFGKDPKMPAKYSTLTMQYTVVYQSQPKKTYFSDLYTTSFDTLSPLSGAG